MTFFFLKSFLSVISGLQNEPVIKDEEELVDDEPEVFASFLEEIKKPKPLERKPYRQRQDNKQNLQSKLKS